MRKDTCVLTLRVAGPWAYVFGISDEARASLARRFGRTVSACFFTISKQRQVFTCELSVSLPPAPPAPTTVRGALLLAWRLLMHGTGKGGLGG